MAQRVSLKRQIQFVLDPLSKERVITLEDGTRMPFTSEFESVTDFLDVVYHRMSQRQRKTFRWAIGSIFSDYLRWNKKPVTDDSAVITLLYLTFGIKAYYSFMVMVATFNRTELDPEEEECLKYVMFTIFLSLKSNQTILQAWASFITGSKFRAKDAITALQIDLEYRPEKFISVIGRYAPMIHQTCCAIEKSRSKAEKAELEAVLSALSTQCAHPRVRLHVKDVFRAYHTRVGYWRLLVERITAWEVRTSLQL